MILNEPENDDSASKSHPHKTHKSTTVPHNQHSPQQKENTRSRLIHKDSIDKAAPHPHPAPPEFVLIRNTNAY